MDACPYCRISGRPSSRIRDEIQANCVKNRSSASSCAACRKLASVDRKIDEARRALNRLLDEREELARTLNDYHDPINQLPPEILTTIFLHCQPLHPDAMDVYWNYDSRSLFSAVLTPGRVCSNWRYVSETSPRLWSVLCININNRRACIRAIEVAQHWLRLSSSVPLYVDIQIYGETILHSIHKLFSIIATAAHRWETLHLNIPKSLISCFSDALSSQDLHLLDALKLKTNWTPGDGALRLNASPRIFVNGGTTVPVDIGLDRLVHFDDGETFVFDLDGYIRLFKTARCLSTFAITTPRGQRTAGSPLEVPSLHTITARDVHDNFWDHFVFPQLQSLSLLYEHRPWRSLESLLRRSRCPLKHLHLDLEQDNEKDNLHTIVGLFEHLQDLEGLVLRFVAPCDLRFFSLLDSLASNNPKIFSKLASIICIAYHPTFDWNPLLVFLTNMTSRNDVTLRSFTFSYDAGDDIEAWDEHDMPLPMNHQTIKFALDATKNLEKANIYDVDGKSVLEEYRLMFGV